MSEEHKEESVPIPPKAPPEEEVVAVVVEAEGPTPKSYGGVSAVLTKYGLGAWYLIGIGLVVAFIIFATAQIQMVFIAVFLALVITSLLGPFVGWLSHWIPRGLATALSLLGTFIFMEFFHPFGCPLDKRESGTKLYMKASRNWTYISSSIPGASSSTTRSSSTSA